MVRRHWLKPLAGVLVLAAAVTGCDKSNSPVVPNSTAVLKLSIPAGILKSKPKFLPVASAKGVHALNTLPDSGQGRLKYNITADGETPVTGSVDFNSGSDVGVVAIPLPKAGKWVVAAEWFYLYDPSAGIVVPSSKVHASVLSEAPEFAGANQVDVEGPTSVTLDMSDISYSEYSCYQGNLTDVTNIDYALSGGWLDLYTFDTAASASTTFIFNTGDIQVSYDGTTASTYFNVPAGNTPVSIYAYLGNGDFVDFPTLPQNSVFYPDTILAKSAVTGKAGSVLAGGDIFVVKVPSTGGVAWVRFNDPVVEGPGNSALESFFFIYNKGALPYMKFDETTYGHNNCNENVSLG